jgi:hypothetical protein
LIEHEAYFDSFESRQELKDAVTKVCKDVMQDLVKGTGFTLDLSMEDCHKDDKVKGVIEAFVENGRMPEVEGHETQTLCIASQLSLVVIEMNVRHCL